MTFQACGTPGAKAGKLYKDDKNRILRLNKTAADSMNMTVEEAEGQDTYDLFPEAAKSYHDDDLKVINSGKAERGIIEEYTPLDGSRGWVKTSKIPHTDPMTGERTVFVASVDITHEKEVELCDSELRDLGTLFAFVLRFHQGSRYNRLHIMEHPGSHLRGGQLYFCLYQ